MCSSVWFLTYTVSLWTGIKTVRVDLTDLSFKPSISAVCSDGGYQLLWGSQPHLWSTCTAGRAHQELIILHHAFKTSLLSLYYVQQTGCTQRKKKYIYCASPSRSWLLGRTWCFKRSTWSLREPATSGIRWGCWALRKRIQEVVVTDVRRPDGWEKCL